MRGERQSLATFTNSPNLEEHFKAAAFLFTDGTGDDLLAEIQSDPARKKSPEVGALIASRYNAALRSLSESLQTRSSTICLRATVKPACFTWASSGNQLGTSTCSTTPSSRIRSLWAGSPSATIALTSTLGPVFRRARPQWQRHPPLRVLTR